MAWVVGFSVLAIVMQKGQAPALALPFSAPRMHTASATLERSLIAATWAATVVHLPWFAAAQVAPPFEDINTYFMPECPPPGCAPGARCTEDQRDKCSSKSCRWDKLKGKYTCGTPRCDDSTQNGWETGKDCGGECVRGCADQGACYAGQDCVSGVCTFRNAYADFVVAGDGGGSCTKPSCVDAVANGPTAAKEPDIDCGDACCLAYKIKKDCPSRCGDGWRCNSVSDCDSERCFKNPKEAGERFCAAPRVSETRTEYGTRIQGGTTVYGPKKLDFDAEPFIKSTAFMLDVPTFAVAMDALVDVQRTREYGNDSYVALRREKGWEPEKTPTLEEVRRQRVLRGSAVSASSVFEAPMHVVRPAAQYASRGNTASDKWLPRSLAEMPTSYPGSGTGWVSSPANLAYEGPSATLAYKFGAGKGEGRTAHEKKLSAKYGEQAVEQVALRNRVLASAMEEGVPFEHERRAQVAFLPTYAISTTHTVIGVAVRYMVYAMPSEALLTAERMTSLLNFKLLPGGWPAEIKLQETLLAVAEDREFCLFYSVNFTLAEFNMTGVDCTPWLGKANTTDALPSPIATNTTANSTATNATGTDRVLHAPNEDVLMIRSPLDTTWLDHPSVRRAVVAHVARACGTRIGMYASPACPREHLTTVPMAHTYGADAAARRRLGLLRRIEGEEDEAVAQDGRLLRMRESSDPRLPRHLQYVPSASIEGLQLMKGVPRVNFADMLAFYGTPVDTSTARGVQALTGGEGTIEAPPGSAAPSNLYQAASISVLDTPRGTPDNPLYDNIPFPLQPTAILRDRFGRHVSTLRTEVRVRADLDLTLYPLDGETTLAGFKTPAISKEGFAVYDDLLVTTNVSLLELQFSALFLTATNQRVQLAGKSRAFTVLPQPPKPIVIFVRTPFNPLLVFVVLALCTIGFGFAVHWARRAGTFFRTPKMRAEMPRPRILPEEEQPVEGEDQGVGWYKPNAVEEVELVEEEEEEVDIVEDLDNTKAIVPVYSVAQLPGLNGAFADAFSQLDARLGDLEDDEREDGRRTTGTSDPRTTEDAGLLESYGLAPALRGAAARIEVDESLRTAGLIRDGDEKFARRPGNEVRVVVEEKRSWFGRTTAKIVAAPTVTSTSGSVKRASATLDMTPLTSEEFEAARGLALPGAIPPPT